MEILRPLLLTILVATLAPCASREIVELQRDVAALQEQVRTLQRSFDERMGTLTTLTQQALEAANRTNTAVAVMETGLRERLSQQLTAPIAGVTTKMEQMSTDFAAVREAVSDLNERMSKLQLQLVDLSNTVKVLQAPPPPPPTAGGQPGSPQAATPPPGLSAKQLYDTALRDRNGGNLDLATQGFEEYLKWFGDTELAPNAQFYVGQISYDRNDFEGAIKAFDAVVERYPENNKTPDALYMKGMALLKSGQRTQAGQEFLTVIQKYPTAEVTAKARAQRKALGLSVPSTTPSKRRK